MLGRALVAVRPLGKANLGSLRSRPGAARRAGAAAIGAAAYGALCEVYWKWCSAHCDTTKFSASTPVFVLRTVTRML